MLKLLVSRVIVRISCDLRGALCEESPLLILELECILSGYLILQSNAISMRQLHTADIKFRSKWANDLMLKCERPPNPSGAEYRYCQLLELTETRVNK